jgi:MATE family multidrug resistance protein
VSAATSSWRDEVVGLTSIAGPVIVAQVGLMLMHTVDAYVVGGLGSESLAAMSVATTWCLGWIVFGQGAAAGLDPLLSQAVGAGSEEERGAALAGGLGWLTLLAVPVMLGHVFAGQGLAALGQHPDVIGPAVAFSRALAPSVPALFLFQWLRTGLQSRGVTSPVLVAVAVGNVLNLALCLWFVRGLGWGAVGAGAATTCVRWAMLVALVPLARPELAAWWRHRRSTWSLPVLRAVGRVALPTSLQIATEVWAFNAGTFIVGWLGPVASAAHAVALHLASLSFMVPLSLGSAAATRVGQRVGEGGTWSPIAGAALRLAASWALVGSAVFALARAPLAGLFLPEGDEAFGLAVALLPFAAAFQLADGMQAVLFGVLRGAGDTRRPMLANVVGYWGLGLPLGAWWSWASGTPQGLWSGLVLALVVIALVLAGRLRAVLRAGAVRVRVEEG